MGGWAQAIATIVANLLITAFFFGSHSRAIKDHDKQFEDNASDRQNQWEAIGNIREDIGKVKGHLRINGGHD